MRKGTNANVVPKSVRAALAAKLRGWWEEIETAIYSEICSVSAGADERDPAYLAELRAAAAEMLDYGIRGIEGGDEAWSGWVPLAATALAKGAARREMELGKVLRGLAAGDRKSSEFVLMAANGLPTDTLRQVLIERGRLVDHFMDTASREYTQEWEGLSRSPAAQLSARLRRLLVTTGPANVSGLDYVFDSWHLGLIALGAEAEKVVRALGAAFDREVLVSTEGEGIVWAWLGGSRPLMSTEVDRYLAADRRQGISFTIGETRPGLEGWRLTHHEAKAAFRVMLRRPQRLIRGRDVALLAAVLQDEWVLESLRETYLRPLVDEHSGLALRRTLQAYLATGLNAASASQVLQIDRSTVQRRLRKIEEQLGRPLHECHAELKVAMELADLTERSDNTVAQPHS